MSEDAAQSPDAQATKQSAFEKLQCPLYPKMTSLEVLGQKHLLHMEEIGKLGKTSVWDVRQAPRTNSQILGSCELMLRQLPNAPNRTNASYGVGDVAPLATLTSSAEKRLDLSSLRGKYYAMRLSRTTGTGMICPGCVPGLGDLIRTKDEFVSMGVELVVVMSITDTQAQQMTELYDLPYEIYADEDWKLFSEYDTDFCSGIPLASLGDCQRWDHIWYGRIVPENSMKPSLGDTWTRTPKTKSLLLIWPIA